MKNCRLPFGGTAQLCLASSLAVLTLSGCAGMDPMDRYKQSADYDPARFEHGYHLKTIGDLSVKSLAGKSVRVEAVDPEVADAVGSFLARNGVNVSAGDISAPVLSVKSDYFIQNNQIAFDGRMGLRLPLKNALEHDFDSGDFQPLKCDKPESTSVWRGVLANAGPIMLAFVPLAKSAAALTVGAGVTHGATQATMNRGIRPCQELSFTMPDQTYEFKEVVSSEFSLTDGGSFSVQTIRNRRGHDPKEVIEQHKTDLSQLF